MILKNTRMISKLSDVQSHNIGEGTRIWQYCVILPEAIIGNNCNICSHCFIENDVIIGNNVTIKCGVQIWDGITIEDDVFIGPNVTFTNEEIPRSRVFDKDNFLKTIIRKGASVGANATIVPGIEIGEYALIGAGSVITKNIPKYTIWYGVPASKRGYITKEGIVLNMNKEDKFGVVHELDI